MTKINGGTSMEIMLNLVGTLNNFPSQVISERDNGRGILTKQSKTIIQHYTGPEERTMSGDAYIFSKQCSGAVFTWMVDVEADRVLDGLSEDIVTSEDRVVPSASLKLIVGEYV